VSGTGTEIVGPSLGKYSSVVPKICMVVNACQVFGDVVQWVADFVGDLFDKIRGLASDLGLAFFVRFGTRILRVRGQNYGFAARSRRALGQYGANNRAVRYRAQLVKYAGAG
jgi:hypothetical protein